MWMVWDSLGWINPGYFLIPPTMNLCSLHCIHGKGIPKHRMIDTYRLYTCHDHRRNTWQSWLGMPFCTTDEACHVVNKGLISPQISSFPCNQLLTGFIWILPLVNIYIRGQKQSFKGFIKYLLCCQWPRHAFILLLWEHIDLSMLTM